MPERKSGEIAEKGGQVGSEEGRVGGGGAEQDLGGRDRVRESRHSTIAGRRARIGRLVITTIIITKLGRRRRISWIGEGTSYGGGNKMRINQRE